MSWNGLNTATAAGRQVNSNLEHQSWIESSNGHCWPAEPSTSDSISPGPWTVLSLGNTALVATLLHTSTNPNPTPTVGNSQICIFGHFWPPQKSHLERPEKKSGHSEAIFFAIFGAKSIISLGTLINLTSIDKYVFWNILMQMCELTTIGVGLGLVEHPDPVPLVNVQLWETRAYKFWRFFESFFWDYTFHIRSQEITYALLKFQGSIWGVIRSEIFTNAIIYQSVNLSLSLY